ncbi:PP0621 family protein [Noviherbaspirillum sp. CPCC 100848]|uniref:PP0621 family protein n=1 Tax=Noviherbaspirillum album TaxID=3080276 RepID=A0ABU6J6F5_9BURK|nr:PP0621 family protein [Noviherbaspirillum sp. CPCC 100848]MEC4719224.1 PP0621 family protein [Noviherbaspirillum sp. CPCC 100848]
MKLLVWVLVAALIVFWIFLSRKKQKAARKPPSASASASASARRHGPGDAEAIIPCTRCGVHLPYSEAVIGATGAPFCSEDHRLQHERR